MSRMFVAWGGCGAVLLRERDDERFAMLLERVEPSTLAEVEDDEVVTVAGRLNRRLAIPAPTTSRAASTRRRTRPAGAQFHAVQAAFRGRRHGFRIARTGPRLDWLTEFVDGLAELLTDRA
jgi:hypothetical protein